MVCASALQGAETFLRSLTPTVRYTKTTSNLQHRRTRDRPDCGVVPDVCMANAGSPATLNPSGEFLDRARSSGPLQTSCAMARKKETRKSLPATERSKPTVQLTAGSFCRRNILDGDLGASGWKPGGSGLPLRVNRHWQRGLPVGWSFVPSSSVAFP